MAALCVKNYIEWDEVKKNFKDFFNANLLDKMSNEKEFKDLGELGILVTGLASKFVDYAIDTYISLNLMRLMLNDYISLHSMLHGTSI